MLPDFDEDYIPLALIALLMVVWLSSIWRSADTSVIAADVLKIGISAIAGYMTRDKQMR
jgi:hypothetical protein